MRIVGWQSENVFTLQVGKEYSCIHATWGIMRYCVCNIAYAILAWKFGVRHWVLCDIRIRYSGWGLGYKQATYHRNLVIIPDLDPSLLHPR